MHDQDIVEYPLDSITQATRFVGSALPKVATRVALGATLALEDAATDPAGELLGAKLVSGGKSIASACGSIARAAGSKVSSVSTNVKAAIAVRSESSESASPIVGRAQALVGKAATELSASYKSAGVVYVQVASEGEPVVESIEE